MRPIAAFHGEGIRLDRALLREARSGFKTVLKQLGRVSCCGGEEEEEECPLTREVVGGDDDSVRVVRFLGGRRKMDSPASSPSPFARCFDDPWPLRGGGNVRDSYALVNSAVFMEERRRQRKDSASEINQNEDSSFKNGVHTLRRAGARKEYLQDVYLEVPRTPTVFTIGPHSDLDWLRFSYLLRNNQLNFDDITELVSRYSLDDGDPLLNDIAQHSLSVDHQPNVRNSTSWSSVRQPGVTEWDVSSGHGDSQASTLSVRNSGSTTGETSCGAENQSSIGIEPFYHEPDETQNLPGDGQTGEMEQLAIRVRGSGYLDQSHHECYSNEPDASQSCFSSDSSIDSTDFSKPEVDVTAARTRPTALSWWRPKRKYDEIHEVTRAASIPNFQEYPVGLWKRISKKTSNHLLNTNPKDEVDRKLQAKLSKIEHSSLRASRVSEGYVNRDSHCHLAHRKQTAAPNVQSISLPRPTSSAQ